MMVDCRTLVFQEAKLLCIPPANETRTTFSPSPSPGISWFRYTSEYDWLPRNDLSSVH